MMMTFRDLFYNNRKKLSTTRKLFLLSCILCVILSCGDKKGISFCEGLDPDGKGMKCGSTFSTGDLTAIITSKSPFNAEKITVRITDITGLRPDVRAEISHNVEPEKARTSLNIPFYTPGKFRVDALKKNEAFATGEVDIINQ